MLAQLGLVNTQTLSAESRIHLDRQVQTLLGEKPIESTLLVKTPVSGSLLRAP